MDPITVRRLTAAELPRVVEVDVTEDGDVVFVQVGTHVHANPEQWSRPPRDAAAWAHHVAGWRSTLAGGGTALGAFDGEHLVGVAVHRLRVARGVDQLEALFVDRAHRRRGIARRLIDEVTELARRSGAATLYVSATPSRSAVGAYLDRGFIPTLSPIPELLAREPEDVHLVLPLVAAGRTRKGGRRSGR